MTENITISPDNPGKKSAMSQKNKKYSIKIKKSNSSWNKKEQLHQIEIKKTHENKLSWISSLFIL